MQKQQQQQQQQQLDMHEPDTSSRRESAMRQTNLLPAWAAEAARGVRAVVVGGGMSWHEVKYRPRSHFTSSSSFSLCSFSLYLSLFLTLPSFPNKRMFDITLKKETTEERKRERMERRKIWSKERKRQIEVFKGWTTAAVGFRVSHAWPRTKVLMTLQETCYFFLSVV